jgi:hypothetical protein
MHSIVGEEELILEKKTNELIISLELALLLVSPIVQYVFIHHILVVFL